MIVCKKEDHQNYSDVDPTTGASNTRGIKNRDFWLMSHLFSEMIQNITTVTMERTRMRAIGAIANDLEWPFWLSEIFSEIARPLCDSWASCITVYVSMMRIFAAERAASRQWNLSVSCHDADSVSPTPRSSDVTSRPAVFICLAAEISAMCPSSPETSTMSTMSSGVTRSGCSVRRSRGGGG